MVVMRVIILFVVFGLAGCAVAPGSRTSAPITRSDNTEAMSLPRIGGSATSDAASVSGSSAVGAGSFPRSLLIPGTDTSIRIGG